MSEIRIRFATEQDAAALAAIYEPYVKKTSISFEYEPPDAAEFERRICNISAQFPYIVCEVDGEIAGYAYAKPFHERQAFQWDAEMSVYLNENYQRMGIASAMCECIFALLKLQGYVRLYVLITIPNEASMSLHSRMGFSVLGTYENCGFKFGEWHNMIVMEKRLLPLPMDPRPPVPVTKLDASFVEQKFLEAEESI